MKKCIIILFVLTSGLACHPDQKNRQDAGNDFTFAFLTDIHLQPERGAIEGFQMAIDCVNTLKPDFVITGGDLVMDAMGVTHERADSLYDLYETMMKKFSMPVYNAIGNHELYGIDKRTGTNPEHPDYGEKMFENRFGKRYYSFDHKGWHFMILDGIEEGTGEWGNYIGMVDSVQLEWIKEDLSATDTVTPIAVCIHIPLITVMPQVLHGPLYNEVYSSVVINSRDVLLPFVNHNLRLVLQGHLHILEEITIAEKTTFITGGAVCGKWWNTPEDTDIQEGFVMVRVKDGDFSWEYIDYGWETLREKEQ
ncbi:MAG: metallophosphoesterase [Bacteroidales bacterium]|nr:metallophosphoesterase [Bacteroidales bacterium]